jgi:hypothetical protein
MAELVEQLETKK